MITFTTSNLNIIIPKGKLFSGSLRFLKSCGVNVSLVENFKGIAKYDCLEVLIARAFDIPIYVESKADLGITGKDIIAETQRKVVVLKKLPFGKCRLSVAVPRGRNAKSVEDMDGFRVATKYLNIAREFFLQKGISVEIVKLRGCVEVAAKLGVADAIVEIIETGKTLRVFDLVEVAKIMDVYAVLIANKSALKAKKCILRDFLRKGGVNIE